MDKRKQGRYILISILAFILFNVPLIQMADKPGDLWGIPYFYLYFFGTWTFISVLVLILLGQHAD
jgi:uncharacterized membrane protein